MAANKRSREQRNIDLERMAEMAAGGMTQADMAKELGISQREVSYDLKKLEKLWHLSLDDWFSQKARELNTVNQLQRWYYLGWVSSRKEKKTTKTKRGKGGEKGDTEQAEVAKEMRDGNPAFLNGIERCIIHRCKLMGITEMSGTSIEAILDKLPREFAARVRLLIADAKQTGNILPDSGEGTNGISRNENGNQPT